MSAKEKAWHKLELLVADLYLELGASNVKHNVNLNGNQIDVYAEVPSLDGGYSRTIVSCKCYKKAAGVPDVREWNQVVQPLKQLHLVDSGVIISPHGFSQDAHSFATTCGIRLLTLDQLRWVGCDFRPYLQDVVNKISETSVFKNSCYIPLSAEDDSTGSVADAGTIIEDFLQNKNEKLLIVLGDFGAGKTTLMRHTFAALARTFLDPNESCRLPVYVNLKDYPGHLNLPSLITDLLVNQHRARLPSFGSLIRLQNEGRMVFIFDAFDEMASRTDYQTTLKNFHAFENLIAANGKVIITCRTHYFKDRSEIKTVYGGTELYKRSRDEGYKMVYLRGFDPKQIQLFVKAVCGTQWNFYLKQIKSIYNLEGLAQRPILLEIITQVLPDIVKGGKTANSTTLYCTYIDYWLKRDDWRTSLNHDERLKFTIAFACDLYAKNASTFNSSDIERAIRTRWPSSSKKELEYYLYDIRTCSFIKWEDRSGNYWFVHNSFMEYFVACKLYHDIIHANKSSFLLKRHSDGVLHFLSEHIQTRQVIETIKSWVAKLDSSPLFENMIPLITKWGAEMSETEVLGISISGLIDCFTFTSCRWRLVQSTAEFLKCKWDKCIINECAFNMASLREPITAETEFVKCSFTDCIIEQANFKDSRFTNTKFLRTALSGELCTVRIDNCFIEHSDWHLRASDVHIFACKFVHFTFDVKELDGVKFTCCNFGEHCKWILPSKPPKWKSPPQIGECEGLKRSQQKALKDLGFVFPKKESPTGKAKSRAKKLKAR